MTRQRAMASSVFERKFESVQKPNGDWNYEFEELRGRDAHHVWTCVEGDNGELYLAPGFHWVNRLGYVLTVRPWTDADDRDGLVVRWS